MVARTTRSKRSTPPLIGSLLLAFLFLQGLGCGLSKSGVYRSELGRAPQRPVLVNVIVGEVESYGFQLQSRSARSLRSSWRRQSPTELSRAGVTKIRDRVTVSIKKRGRKYYVASLRIRHEARVNGEWKAVEPSESMVDQYEEMRENIREELRQYMTQKR